METHPHLCEDMLVSPPSGMSYNYYYVPVNYETWVISRLWLRFPPEQIPDLAKRVETIRFLCPSKKHTLGANLERATSCRHGVCNVNISWMQQMRNMGLSHSLPVSIGTYFCTSNLQRTRKYTPQVRAPVHGRGGRNAMAGRRS